MAEFEQHGYQGFWLPHRRLDGQHGIVVVIKRRYNVNTVEATCDPSDETPPVAFMAEFYDDADPPNVSVRHPGEVAPEKRFVDLMVRGTAYAPGGVPTKEFTVELRIPGLIQRKLRIIGDRKCVWYPPMKELTYKDLAKGEQWQWLDPDFTEPEPIDKLPLRYESSYGGWGKIVLSEDELEMAEEAQGVAEVQDKRRDRKKEIEAELKAEEEEKKKKASKKDEPKPKDEKAQKLAEKAFADAGDETRDEGGTKVIGADVIARLEAEEAADDGMQIVSAYRLGRDMPDRPEDVPRDEAAEPDDAAEEEAKKAPPAKDDPSAAFFSKSEGATQALDLAALAENQDELKRLLEEEDTKRARELTDDEGVLRSRATEFGDIKLSGDDWAAQYVRKRPPKKKKERDKSDHPEMPYPSNPCGKGFACSPREEAIADLPLPNIEDPDDPIKEEDFVVDLADDFDLKKLRPPAGWAPYPMGWYPRAQYFGIFPWDAGLADEGKKLATADFDPEDPDDKKIIEVIDGVEVPLFQILAYQEAHPKLWVKDIRGDEEIYLTNLTPDGHLFFRLPGLHPTATIDMSEGPIPLAMRLDQVLFDLDDPERPAVELLWRGWHALRDFDELGEKPFRRVNIIEVDQVDWLDVKRDEAAAEAGVRKGGLTGFIEAVSDEDLERDVDQKYKDQFKRTDDRRGVRKDGFKDAAVFNQDEDRQLYGDEWDEQIRSEKDDFHEMAAKRAEEAEKEREKERKKKAREMVDEEFGIIRDDDGEILVVDESLAEPPAGGDKPKGKKK